MLLGALLTTTAAAILGLWSGGISGALLVGFAVGLSVSSGKLAFDSIVQRDAPDANYGRSFARFETRFQLMWVFGALIPVIFTLPARLGFLVLAIAAGFASMSYMFGANNAGINTSQNIFSLLRNLLQKQKLAETEETGEPDREAHSETIKTEKEIFTPYPHDDDDDNLKLF